MMPTSAASTPAMPIHSDWQHTLRAPVRCGSVGLHTGALVTLRMFPAPAGSGIVFLRTDALADGTLPEALAGHAPGHSAARLQRAVDACLHGTACASARIPAHYELVTDTRLGTTLTNAHGVSMATVEHVMAALWGCGIDNALILVDGPEVPVMDGSSAPFVQAIRAVGVQRQQTRRRWLTVTRPVTVQEGGSTLTLRPFHGFRMEAGITFHAAAIGQQSLTVTLADDTFTSQLADARTFGFAHEVDQLRAMGLARGGSLDNAVVFGDTGVLNPGGLRHADECIRHKVLDCIGDLYLAGYRLRAEVVADRPGHTINNAVLYALMEDSSQYRLTTDTAAGCGRHGPATGYPAPGSAAHMPEAALALA